jgi:hypothetical protein
MDAARCKPGIRIVYQRSRKRNGLAAVARILLDGPVPCVLISGAPLRFSRTAKQVLRKPFAEGGPVRAINGPVVCGIARGNLLLTH